MSYQIKPIPNFPGYWADTDGNVWSGWEKKGCGQGKGSRSINTGSPSKMKLATTRHNGYKFVILHRNGRKYSRAVHRLVLEAFVGFRPNGKECCHNDGNPANNKLENLRWDTRKSNVADSITHGTHKAPPRNDNSGEKHGLSKLNEMQVRIIKKYPRYKGQHCGYQKDLSEIFGVSRSCIRNIISGQRWKHI